MKTIYLLFVLFVLSAASPHKKKDKKKKKEKGKNKGKDKSSFDSVVDDKIVPQMTEPVPVPSDVPVPPQQELVPPALPTEDPLDPLVEDCEEETEIKKEPFEATGSVVLNEETPIVGEPPIGGEPPVAEEDCEEETAILPVETESILTTVIADKSAESSKADNQEMSDSVVTEDSVESDTSAGDSQEAAEQGKEGGIDPATATKGDVQPLNLAPMGTSTAVGIRTQWLLLIAALALVV